MGRNKKELTEDELFIRECKDDKDVKHGIKCACGQLHYITQFNKDYFCVSTCGRIVIDNYVPHKKNCQVLFTREE